MNVQNFLTHLQGVKKTATGWQALCPAHEDRIPSLSIGRENGNILLHCHAGCKTPDIVKSLGLEMKDLFVEEITKKSLVRAYDYTDTKGNLLFQVCRYEPKTFRQRRPDGNNGWLWNLNGTRRVLYNLPEVLKATEIIFVEGEKDSDALKALGFVATTSPMGAGKFRAEYTDFLAGKDVVLIPDNDDEGRSHMEKVAGVLNGIASSVKWIDLPDLPEKGDISDFIATFDEKKDAAERLSIMIEGAPKYKSKEDQEADPIQFIDASRWLETEPEAVDPILGNIFDKGDKVAIIGALKQRKTFFVDQMAICLAAGRPFLTWENPKPRRVALIQFEIQSYHKHRRIKRLANALRVTPSDMADRLQILNARGLDITGRAGLEKITPAILNINPDIIIFDPLYKLSNGKENAAEDAKIILNAFDVLAQQTGAAILYVHHDAKGSPGDRDIRDRGAGSNVIGRDYDCCFTLTGHAEDEDCIVVETLLRNYAPQDDFVIQWTSDEGKYCFRERPDYLPRKKTSKTKPKQPPLTTYLPAAELILGIDEMEIAIFKEKLKAQTGLSDRRIRDFMAWATSGGNPFITTRELRGYRTNKKWVRVGRQADNE